MKNLFAAVLVLVAVVTANAQVSLPGGATGVGVRVAALEAPGVTIIASNATTAQVDFRQGPFAYTNGLVIGTRDYQVIQLNGNITFQLTNVVPGVRREIFVVADGTARQFSISTNGLTSQTRIDYDLSLSTNGSYAMSITNRAKILLVPRPQGEVEINVTYYQ